MWIVSILFIISCNTQMSFEYIFLYVRLGEFILELETMRIFVAQYILRIE